MPRFHTIEIFRGLSGRWYWRMRAPNNLITCDGAQGYSTKANARRAAIEHCKMIRTRTIRIVDGPEKTQS